MVPFDRSWHNRAGVERVMGLCSDDEQQLRILGRIHDDYEEFERPPIELPARVRNPDGIRQPVPDEVIVPEVCRLVDATSPNADSGV